MVKLKTSRFDFGWGIDITRGKFWGVNVRMGKTILVILSPAAVA